MSPLDATAHAVLSHYPGLLRPTGVLPLGNRGGFSGARIWRVLSTAGPLCLRAWPPEETTERLAFRHHLMHIARKDGLSFVPTVFAATGATVVPVAGRLWELQEWLPGQADYRAHPSPARLEAACHALARLHIAWGSPGQPAPCPAVQRRLDCVREWDELLQRPLPPTPSPKRRGGAKPTSGSPLRFGEGLLERARQTIEPHLPRVPDRLRRWQLVPLPLQPCLCDVRSDHLLFEGDRLTGLVDYGAVKIDTVAVDLARMLGELVEDDDAGWANGLRAYRAVRPLQDEEAALARALDVTGTVLGVVNWLRWLLVDRRSFDDGAAVARRLEELVTRMERWGPKRG